MADDDLIYSRELLRRCRHTYPQFVHFIDVAEMSAPAMEALAGKWRGESIVPALPLQRRPLSLHVRCAIFAVLATFRGVELTEGLARELEADALFPAATIARAELELVGLTARARQLLPQAAAEPLDPMRLHRATFRLLFGSRQLAGPGLARNFPTSELINAGKQQLGDHFGEDYGLLSEIAHPNSLVLWFADPAAGDLVSFERRGISEANMEILLKVCGQGIRLIGHNCQWLIEWSAANDVELPFIPADPDTPAAS